MHQLNTFKYFYDQKTHEQFAFGKLRIKIIFKK